MRLTLALLVAMTPAICAGQAGPAGMDSTKAQQTMVRAAGMPLNDGTLAPGTLTVRIVRGAFAANLPDQTIQLDVSGRIATERTGADGRASFAHLPVGAQVRASAMVEGQQLASDTFAMPADSGVRVLLVVDDGAGDRSVPSDSQVAQVPMTSIPPSSAAQSTVASPMPGATVGETVVQVALLLATLGGFALVVFRRTPSDDGGR